MVMKNCPPSAATPAIIKITVCMIVIGAKFITINGRDIKHEKPEKKRTINDPLMPYSPSFLTHVYAIPAHSPRKVPQEKESEACRRHRVLLRKGFPQKP